MAIFGKNGFIQKQEVAFAKKLLVWQYKRSGQVLPDDAAVSSFAEKIVAEAHIIAKKSGSSVTDIVRGRVKEIINKLMK